MFDFLKLCTGIRAYVSNRDMRGQGTNFFNYDIDETIGCLHFTNVGFL